MIVYIEEMNKLADVAFPMRPMVMSLKDYDLVGDEELPAPIQGYPVVCVSVRILIINQLIELLCLPFAGARTTFAAWW